MTYRLEITPGDNTNPDDFDLAAEILSPANRVISKADAEEADAHEMIKTHTLLEQPAGHYLVHLYLEGRLDTADFTLKLSWKPVAPAEQKSDFPAQVAFLPALAMVPLQDDTPAGYKPKAPPTPPGPHKPVKGQQPRSDPANEARSGAVGGDHRTHHQSAGLGHERDDHRQPRHGNGCGQRNARTSTV